MSGIELKTVSADEAGMRLDRWFKTHFPGLGFGHLQKLLRTGQVRVDGKRADSATRLATGQSVRVPPLPEALPSFSSPSVATVPDRLVKDLLARVLYRDEDVLVINKPFGLAVQGGTGTTVHLDGALDALRFGSPHRPKLVHRLDRDTAGVLVLGRTPEATRRLAESFRLHRARKYYWALTLGRPNPPAGSIEGALAKSGDSFEKMELNTAEGRDALTHYSTVQTAGKLAAWVALWPVTGRTHQLRAHLALLGNPILGDPKYGRPDDFGLPKKLYLFARRLIVPHPGKKGMLDIVAPPPDHFKPAFAHFGFQGLDDGDPFRDVRA